MYKIVIEDQVEEENHANILNFIPKSFTLAEEIHFNKGIEHPLVFEDVQNEGYRMWKDEFTGFDLAHAEVGLDILGKMHALGLVLLDKKIVEDHSLTELLNFNLLKLLTEPIRQIVDIGMNTLLEWMKNNKKDDEDEVSIRKLAQYFEKRKGTSYLK